MKRIYRLLTLTDTPLILAMLLGVVAWLASGVVSRQFEEPVLEYTVAWIHPESLKGLDPSWEPILTTCYSPTAIPEDTKKLLLATFHNLSPSSRMDDINFEFAMTTANASILSVADRGIPPERSTAEQPVCDASSASIRPITIQPGGVIQFLFTTSAKEQPELRILSGKSAVRIVAADIGTALMKHYAKLGLITAASFAFLVIIYLIAIDKLQQQSIGNRSQTK
jgi:hypothetical protein